MTTCFDSTIALTVYNLLCTHKARMARSDLLKIATQIQHPGLDPVQFDRAVAEMINRGMVTENDSELVLVDQDRRVVVQRELKDMMLGAQQGGWGGWMVRDMSGGSNKLRALKSVLEEAKP